MKKLFLLLAMVGLAFASCTPAGEDDGGQTGPQGGGNEFTFTVTNIGEQSADYTVTAKEETRTFYWNCHTKADVMSEGTVAFMEYYYDMLKEAVDGGSYTWAELLDTGYAEHSSTKLRPATKYILWAFGIDANGNLTSTDLSYYEFETKPSSFDSSVWSGTWNVTSPNIFVEFITADSEGKQVYNEKFVTPEEPYTRSIEIIDGASMDASLNGYALVYGWDGNFPDSPTTGEDFMPAFGVYNANAIDLVNGEVVYDDASDGSVLMWLPVCEDVEKAGSYTYVTGDFAPYKFVMGADGAVTIEGAAGIGLNNGTTVDVKLFHLVWLMGNSVYPGIMSDGPVYHFAGSNMTAAKAEDNGVAPAKLSAKKNIKVMHKYANAKSAAMQFSSAVKMAKLAK